MGFKFDFYPKYEFAYTQCYGIIDDRSMHIHLMNYNLEADSLELNTIRELADTRNISKVNKATAKGFIEMARFDMEKSTGRREYLAILASDALIEQMAGLYGKSIDASKEGIGIFYDVKTALAWLGYDSSKINAIRKFMKENQV